MAGVGLYVESCPAHTVRPQLCRSYWWSGYRHWLKGEFHIHRSFANASARPIFTARPLRLLVVVRLQFLKRVWRDVLLRRNSKTFFLTLLRCQHRCHLYRSCDWETDCNSPGTLSVNVPLFSYKVDFVETATVGVYTLTSTCEDLNLAASDVSFPFCDAQVEAAAPQYVIPAIQTFVCDTLQSAIVPSLQSWIAPGRVRLSIACPVSQWLHNAPRCEYVDVNKPYFGFRTLLGRAAGWHRHICRVHNHGPSISVGSFSADAGLLLSLGFQTSVFCLLFPVHSNVCTGGKASWFACFAITICRPKWHSLRSRR